MKRTYYLIAFLFLMVIGKAQQPKLMLPVGHTEIITTARFSPDGKYVISGGEDKTAIVWEANTGRKIQDLGSNSSEVNYAYFSNDTKYLAVGTDSIVTIWSVPEYSMLGQIHGVRKTIFSPDGKKLFLQGFNGNSRQLQLPSLTSEFEYQDNVIYEGSSSVKTVRMAISPDSKLLCNAGDSVLTVRNVNDGKILLQKIITSKPQLCFFSADGLYLIAVTEGGIKRITLKNNFPDTTLEKKYTVAAVLSTNSKFLLITSGMFNKSSSLWDMESYRPVFYSDSIYSVSDTLPLLDKNGEMTGYKFGTAALNFPEFLEFVSSVEVGNNGRYIRVQHIIWDCLDNTKSYMTPNYLKRSEISPDGKYMLVLLAGNSVALWDIAARSIIQTYQTQVKKIRTTAISPDGKQFAVGSEHNIKLVDLETGRTRFNLKGHTNSIASLYFSADSKKVLSNSYDSTARLWDANTGLVIKIYKGQYPETNPAWFAGRDSVMLPNVRMEQLQIAGIDGKDLDTTIVQLLENPESLPEQRSAGGTYGFYKTPYDGVNFIWGQPKALELPSELNHRSLINAFSQDEKWLAIALYEEYDTLLIGDIQSGEWLFSGKLGIVPAAADYASRRTEQLAFTSDKKYLLAADANAVIHILSTNNFKEIAQLPGKRFYFSADDRYLLVLNQGNTDIYDFEKRKLLYTYISVDSVNHLVLDGQKRFDGTEMARTMLYYVCGNEFIDLAQFKDQLWVPNLAERVIKKETINAKTLEELNICGLTPVVEDGSSHADEYYFKIIPRRGGLGETVMYVNGIEAKRFTKDQLKKNGAAYELIVKKNELSNFFISGKENPVTVKAYTSDNTISSRGLIIKEDKTKETTRAPNLFAVMVGISDYKGEELDLKYAAKDASDISATIAAAAKKLLNADGLEHVFMYDLTTSKDRYQLPEKNSIKKVLEVIASKANANDILLIFFAGHGVMSAPSGNSEDAKKKQFYFLTADASKTSALDAIADVGISTEELSEWMKPQNIKAQKRILIFDACNSGQAIKDFVKMGNENQNYIAARNDDKSQQIKAIDKLNEKSGLFILSASASDQSAYEMSRYSQGLLTYSLLKAIKQQPDILEDGKYLNLGRWFNAAEKTVSEVSKENGARQDPQVVTNTNFNIGIVDAEVMAGIVLPMVKPLFMASHFQNADENIIEDDLALNKLTDQELNEISSRGSEASIKYLDASNLPDAYSLIGRYTVVGNNISIKIIIRHNNDIVHRMELRGTKDSIKELSKLITRDAINWVTLKK